MPLPNDWPLFLSSIISISVKIINANTVKNAMTIRKLIPARCFSFHDPRLNDRFERVLVPNSKFVLLPFGGLLPFVYIFRWNGRDDDDDNDGDAITSLTQPVCRSHLDVNERIYFSNDVVCLMVGGQNVLRANVGIFPLHIYNENGFCGRSVS